MTFEVWKEIALVAVGAWMLIVTGEVVVMIGVALVTRYEARRNSRKGGDPNVR